MKNFVKHCLSYFSKKEEIANKEVDKNTSSKNSLEDSMQKAKSLMDNYKKDNKDEVIINDIVLVRQLNNLKVELTQCNSAKELYYIIKKFEKIKIELKDNKTEISTLMKEGTAMFEMLIEEHIVKFLLSTLTNSNIVKEDSKEEKQGNEQETDTNEDVLISVLNIKDALSNKDIEENE